MKMLARVSLALFTLSLIGCASTDGEGKYRVQSIGNAQRSVEAEILTVSPAYIQTATSGAGRALGGTVGGGLAAEGSNNAAVIIAGIIGGALIGDYIEGQQNVHDATEYVIKTSTNVLLTVAQVNQGNEIFSINDKVILVYGYPVRLIKDPR